MARLKYPLELNEVATDYISFTHFKYRLNRRLPGAGGSGPGTFQDVTGGFQADPPSEDGSNEISLYVPRDLPAMRQTSKYNTDTQPGELGQLKRSIAAAAAGVGYANDVGDAATKAADALEQAVSGKGFGTALSAGRQAIVEGVAGSLGQDAGNIIAMATGKLLNPNVEVIYAGPTLREFPLSFTFAAKSKEEADAIKDIIFEFKKWSAPGGGDGDGGMLTVPHVWRVKYKGKFEKNFNPFKRAVLESVNVDYNSGLDTHMTFDDGEPVIVQLSLMFKEVDYILRKDHDEARSSGFLGGY